MAGHRTQTFRENQDESLAIRETIAPTLNSYSGVWDGVEEYLWNTWGGS